MGKRVKENTVKDLWVNGITLSLSYFVSKPICLTNVRD